MSIENSKVIEAVESMTEAFHKKDVNGVLTCYEDGAGIMFEPGKRISDPIEIKQMFEGAFKLNPKYSYPSGHEAYIANDIALHIAPWIMTGRAPDGTEVAQNGLSVAVLRKQPGGKWLLVLDNPHGDLLIENNQ